MSDTRSSTVSVGSGYGLGSILAAILSWTVNHSILWAILHFFCGWFYVIYWAITKAG